MECLASRCAYLHYLQYLVISTIYLQPARQVPGPGAAGDHRAQLRGPGAEAGAGRRGGAGGVDRLRHPRQGVDFPSHLSLSYPGALMITVSF